MRGFNRVIIAGNLARDPDIRRTLNKKTFARFTVVVNSRYKDNNGEYQETADYISVVAWGAWAETCEKYLKKGSPVLVEGSIRTGSYEAKDGSKRYTTDVNMTNMIMLGSGQRGSGGQAPSSPQSYGADIPASSDFGTSIGENGFGGESFTQDFGSSDNNNVPGGDDAGIPF